MTKQMMSKVSGQIGCVVRMFRAVALLLVIALGSDLALAACSPYMGTVVFNEVQIPNGGTNYVELKVLSPSVVAATANFTNWYIAAYEPSTGALYSTTSVNSVFTNISTNICGQSSPWIQIPDPALGGALNTARNSNANLNFVLYETSSGTSQIVDVLRMGSQTNLYTPGTSFGACSTIDSTFTTQYGIGWGSGSSAKDWYRTPDGTGPWAGTATANNTNSICGSNDANTPAQVGLTKTTSTSSVNTNTNFDFTLYAQNPSIGTPQSSVVVTDNLTAAGLTFVGCTVTPPDTCTNSANTVTWTISSLPVSSTDSATLTVFAPSSGTKTNTISANTTGTPTTSVSVAVSATAPLVTTLAATSAAYASATLNGSINPKGTSTTVSFGYSAFNGSYTSTCSPSPNTFSGTTVLNFSCALTGLSCGTTYYFRAQGSYGSATSNGGQLNFTTSPCGAVFDAYETSYTSGQAIAGSARIKTHVASSSGLCVSGVCNLTIAAFNLTKTALATSFIGPVKVEIVDASSGSCASYALLATASSSLPLTAGLATLTLPAVVNAYPNAAVRIGYPATGTVTSQSCSSDNFAIRPSSFGSVSATDGSWTTAGSINALSNKTLATTTPIHKAGRPFSFNATAINAQGTTTGNYTGTPTIVLSACSGGTACTSTWGTFAPGSGFVAGVLASNTATYNDIGSFSLVLQDTTFANVDAADSSTTLERYITSSAIDAGRFVPDHFDTVVSSQGCSTFTYSGQPLSLRVTARDASGNAMTRYDSSALAKSITLGDANAVAGSLASTSSTFAAGVSSNTAPTFTFTSRTTAPAPIKLRVLDADSVSSSTGNDGTAATATEGTSTIVSGRVKLLNAYGSERLALPLITTREYYDTAAGTGWRSGTGYVDTCTKLTANNFAFSTTASNCATPVASCITALSVTATGSGPYQSPWTVGLSAPSPAAAGNICITLSLDGTATGSQCTATGTPGAAATSASAPWLRYPWSGASVTNPAARATFGIYKSPLIYRRENY